MRAGEYILKLSSPGFAQLQVEDIRLADGNRTVIPILTLPVGYLNFTDRFVDYLRLTGRDNQTGDLGATVKLSLGPSRGDGPALVRCTVHLLCRTSIGCPSTETSADGSFLFRFLKPGVYSIVVSKPGYYSDVHEDFVVQSGIQSFYPRLLLTLCRNGNCDPRSRPKEPLPRFE